MANKIRGPIVFHCPQCDSRVTHNVVKANDVKNSEYPAKYFRSWFDCVCGWAGERAKMKVGDTNG